LTFAKNQKDLGPQDGLLYGLVLFSPVIFIFFSALYKYSRFCAGYLVFGIITMADEVRELMNKKDEIEKEIKEYHDVLQSVGLTILIYRVISKNTVKYHNIAENFHGRRYTCEPVYPHDRVNQTGISLNRFTVIVKNILNDSNQSQLEVGNMVTWFVYVLFSLSL